MKTYAAIDLKSFYASVECRERNLDPLDTNLVVADIEHSEKTICLAITPSLKAQGISGRPRLFEVIQKTKEINQKRKIENHNRPFIQSSISDSELKKNPNLQLDYIIAPPRMALYMEYSTQIYKTYLNYVSEQDIYVYSIDEVFIDITSYLKYYDMQAEEFVKMLIQNVYAKTGITATAGIANNLYLCKVAMDIVAKHKQPDQNGVRIACLDEMSYKKTLWNHTPITDFWRVGTGYAKKLAEHHMYTMKDIAACSLQNEDLLFQLFGIQAEWLIDHAWGYEPCTMQAIKNYKPSNKSICTSQVLHEPYTYQKGRIIIKEMADELCLNLIQKGYYTNELTLVVGYDICNLQNKQIASLYQGEIKTDNYGRKVPKHTRSVVHIEEWTQSSQTIRKALLDTYDRIVIPYMYIRKVSLTASKIRRNNNKKENHIQQYSLFDNIDQLEKQKEQKKIQQEKETKIQQTVMKIKQKYGKNSVLKATSALSEATMKERNEQIGGHKA